LIILIYWVISEIFTMLFRFTGLPAEKARFQVISLLTGCGFTTRESEMFLTSKLRRRLAWIIMLFGYVFNITIISAFVNVFFSLNTSELVADLIGLFIPLLSIVVIVLFIRIPKIRSWGEKLLRRIVGKLMRREGENSVLLMDYIGEDVIAQVTLYQVPEELREKPLSETGLKQEHNILVMLVDRGKAEPATAATVFLPGDKLTVFGDYKTICQVFHAQERYEEE
ncbi:MAG: TrkA C-terminal domain-containing protein, partial [bacterium]